ncbi:MAG TPA: DUF4342 domain-containing protein [Dehalococcoidia bacterium]|nr:DUF4342 domain-containing protein [Dehalococcoidia bacterium]
MATATEPRTWTERIDLAGKELVERVKDLIEQGNVRRLIIRGQNEEFRIDIPLTAGVAVGGVLAVFSPVLAALGALAALVTRVDLEIVRVGEPETAEQEEEKEKEPDS